MISDESKLVVLIDDRRVFIDDRIAVILRTSQEALTYLRRLHELGMTIDELWLDHDLGLHSQDDISAVLTELEREAVLGKQYDIGVIYVHTANPAGQRMMMRSLTHHGYNARLAVNADFGTFIDKDWR